MTRRYGVRNHEVVSVVYVPQCVSERIERQAAGLLCSDPSATSLHSIGVSNILREKTRATSLITNTVQYFRDGHAAPCSHRWAAFNYVCQVRSTQASSLVP